jgi:hypothetical protein
MKNNKNKNNMKKVLVFITALLFGTFCMAQTGQTLEPGQSMTLDVNGNLVTSITIDEQNTNGKIQNLQPISEVEDYQFNADGTLKLPGYKPTGNAETDAELYKKAKYLLFQNNPEEYQRIFMQQEMKMTPRRILYDEFITFPENKRNHILANPEKYQVIMPNNDDCK